MKIKLKIVFLVMFLSLFVIPLQTQAHSNYVSSDPAPNSILTEEPSRVTIKFTEPVQPGTDYISVLLSKYNFSLDNGQAAVVDPTDPTVIYTPLNTKIPINYTYDVYTVIWSTNSATDGHYTSGSFSFAVQYPNGTLPYGGNINAFRSVTVSPTYINIDIVGKFLAFISLVIVIMDNFLMFPAEKKVFSTYVGEDKEKIKKYYQQFIRIGYLGALGYFISMLIWFLSEAASLESQHFVHVGYLAFLIIFDANTLIQPFYLGLIIKIFLSLITFLIARRYYNKVQKENYQFYGNYHKTIIGLSLISLLIEGITTHPGGTSLWFLAIPIDFIHLVGVSAWAGGTLVIAITFYTFRKDFDEEFHKKFAWTFGSIVKYSLYSILITGTLLAIIFVGPIDQYLGSFYGQIVLLKVVLFGVIILFGKYNGKTLRNIGKNKLPFYKFARNMYLEVGLVLVILFVAAFLSYIPPSTDAGIDTSISDLTAYNGGVKINLRVSPRPQVPGVFNYTVLVYDSNTGANYTLATNVSIMFQLMNSSIRSGPYHLDQIHSYEYSATLSAMSQPGTWQLKVVVSRANLIDVSALFNFVIFPH